MKASDDGTNTVGETETRLGCKGIAPALAHAPVYLGCMFDVNVRVGDVVTYCEDV